MDYLLYANDSLVITMVKVSLDLRCSRISWMLILYVDFISCCFPEVVPMEMIRYSLRYSKVI